MRLERWALVSEVVGATAIVAWLVFIRAQIKQSTTVAKATTSQNLLEQIGAWRSQVVEDTELAKLFVIYNRGEANNLTVEEQARMDMYEATYFGIFETGFFARNNALMDDSGRQRLSFGACVHLRRPRSNYGDSELPTLMTDEYVEYLDANCRIRRCRKLPSACESHIPRLLAGFFPLCGKVERPRYGRKAVVRGV